MKTRQNIVNYLLTFDYDRNKLLEATKTTNKRFYLFGLLPIIRRKQYALTKIKYYLFEKSPLIKEKDGKICLFEFINIGALR